MPTERSQKPSSGSGPFKTLAVADLLKARSRGGQNIDTASRVTHIGGWTCG